MSEARKTLLIVDDEETIHRALKRTLRREPYDLLHAYDAAEASAILGSHDEIAGIICDHYMPGTHGLDLLIEIRKRYPDLVTILLTAQADLQLVMSALNDGHIHRVLTKPWDNDDLRKQLRETFREAENPVQGKAREMSDTERKLRDELMPLRDTTSGAFIIDPEDLE